MAAVVVGWCFRCFFFFQAEDGIRDLVRSRGLGDVYKRQAFLSSMSHELRTPLHSISGFLELLLEDPDSQDLNCLLYTSDAADERSSVDLGGRRIINKKKTCTHEDTECIINT